MDDNSTPSRLRTNCHATSHGRFTRRALIFSAAQWTSQSASGQNTEVLTGARRLTLTRLFDSRRLVNFAAAKDSGSNSRRSRTQWIVGDGGLAVSCFVWDGKVESVSLFRVFRPGE